MVRKPPPINPSIVTPTERNATVAVALISALIVLHQIGLFGLLYTISKYVLYTVGFVVLILDSPLLYRRIERIKERRRKREQEMAKRQEKRSIGKEQNAVSISCTAMSSVDRLVLAIDVGSSSIRCSAFRIVDRDIDDADTVPTVQAVEGCSVSKKLQAVQPNTGKINVYLDHAGSIFDEIDSCVDDSLVKLRRHYRTDDDEEEEKKSFVVQGVGFSTFVMNLIGVDEEGRPVGNDATMSYACNTPAVVAECERLRNELGQERLTSLYQRTGAPLHSAYALPQLCVFYAAPPSSSSNVTSRIYKWTTLASICINRWTGGNLKRFQFPMSPSEASWTGMYAFRGTDWDEEVKLHLPHEARATLPAPCDFDAVPDHLLGIHRDSPYWDRWPELRGGDHLPDQGSNYCCRLTPGIGDGACANIGSKCTTS